MSRFKRKKRRLRWGSTTVDPITEIEKRTLKKKKIKKKG
jgi:hypothetical protein